MPAETPKPLKPSKADATTDPDPAPLVANEAKRDSFLLRIPKPISGALVMLVAGLLLFAFAQYISREIREADKDIRGDLAEVKGIGPRMDRLERTLDDFIKGVVSKDSLGRLLKQTTTGTPEKLKDTLPVANNLLRTAQASGVVLEPKEIAELGPPLVDASLKYILIKSVGWSAVTEFAAYRSFVNAQAFPVTIKEGSVNPHGMTMRNNLIQGGSWELDNKTIKGDTYEHAVIVYNGGPLSLENVRFDHCAFRVIANDAGGRFMKSLLSAVGPTVSL